MQAGIKITMIWADVYDVDELSEFILQVSNGSCVASQQFYLNRGGFKDFAKELRNFPSSIESRIKFECGGQDRSWATYLLFEVFCYEPTGRSAIKVQMETHFDEPHYCKSDFFIICYPAALNILGEKLSSWNPWEERKFEWYAE